MVREPLNGEECTLPVPMDVRMPCASYQTVVRGLATIADDTRRGRRRRRLSIERSHPLLEE